MQSPLFALLTLALFLLGPSAQAARFANQFIEFELPPQWQCTLEGAEWVCQSTDAQKKRDALIILAAKLKGDQDSLDQYLNFLKSPKSFTSVSGKPMRSDTKYAKTISINNHPWVDALHFESEIPNYYTRYLATVKQDIGVVVSYSISRPKYQNYIKEFETMVRTLKVFRKEGGINVSPQGANLFAGGVPQGLSESAVFSDVNPKGGASDTKRPAPTDDSLFIILGVVGAALAYLWWRRKQTRG